MILYVLLCVVSVAFADAINLGSILRPPDGVWHSEGGNFTFGFHSSANDGDKYVVGISFGNIKKTTFAWTTGGVRVSDGAQLRFQSNGDLVLFDSEGNVVWQSNTSDRGVVSAEMRDNGNFILNNRSAGVVWESFAHPTDTLLVGQKLSEGKALNAYPYSFSLQSGGNLTLKWRNNITYWNPTTFSHTSATLHLFLSNQGILGLSNSSGDPYWEARSSDYTDDSITIRRVTLDSDGNLRSYAFISSSQSWQVKWSAVNDQCRVYGWCGDNGMCVYNYTTPICTCLSGDFTAVDPNDFRQGCRRLEDVASCPNNQSMVVLDHTELLLYPPESNDDFAIYYLGDPDCWRNCLRNPSCTGSTTLNDGSGTCTMRTSNFTSGYSSVTIPSTSYVKVCGQGRPLPLLPLPPYSPQIEDSDNFLEIQLYIFVAGAYSTVR